MDEPAWDDVEEERRELSMTREEKAEQHEEESARRHNNILRRLRVALREDPPGDGPIMAWLVRHFAPNAEHVLQAYGLLLQGSFGRVEPMPGKPPEEAYPCGTKTLRAYPARLVDNGPFWIAVASQIRGEGMPVCALPFDAPDVEAARVELAQRGKDELRLHGPYRWRDDAAFSLNAWLEGRKLDP
jgi:hypothetical protein